MSVIQAGLFTPDSRLNHHDRLMIWAACCTGYSGFMRSGEFTACRANQGPPTLLVSNVSTDSLTNPWVIRIFLKKAKTNPFGNGVHLYLGKTSAAVCPVKAVLSFLAILAPDPLGPLFVWNNGSALSQQQLVIEVRSVLREAGVDDTSFAGHSFRIGAATSAARAGIPSHTIKMLGRWESDAYMMYIQTPRETLASISSRIAPENHLQSACQRPTGERHTL